MKYEMIFGDEKLFDGAPEDAVIAIKRPFISGVRSGKMYLFSSAHDAIVEAGSSFNFNNVILKTSEYAERRIIKEPKRWTWEDKKACRLPEVLGKVTTYDGRTYLFVGESCHDNQWSLKDNSTGKVYHTLISDIFPIETPAEKAQREEDEFVDSLIEKGLVYTSFYVDGIRAAYRKLKGGE